VAEDDPKLGNRERPSAEAWRHYAGCQVPLDKSEDVVRGTRVLDGGQHRQVLPEKVEAQDSGTFPPESLCGRTCRTQTWREQGEDYLSGIAALRNMMGDIGDYDASQACHG